MGFLSGVMNKLGLSEAEANSGELTESRISQWLKDRIAKDLAIPSTEIDPSRTFESYGLDSLMALELAGDLEKLMERRLSPALLFEHPSIDALSRHLANELASGEASAAQEAAQ